jgi:hypothetical protein
MPARAERGSFGSLDGRINPKHPGLYTADATGAAQYRRGLERIAERIGEFESKRRDLDETPAGLRALELEAKERLDRALIEEAPHQRSKNSKTNAAR